MKILITGNKKYGLAKALSGIYSDAVFASRETGFDFSNHDGFKKIGLIISNFDVFINCSALFKFNQTVLLDHVYKRCQEINHKIHIINIGSTTDRVKKATSWIYNAEKKALRDFSNSLSLSGVWAGGPKVSLISFGSLSNVQHKHPDRICLDIDRAANYVKWIVEQPEDICINEISLDPLQVIHD